MAVQSRAKSVSWSTKRCVALHDNLFALCLGLLSKPPHLTVIGASSGSDRSKAAHFPGGKRSFMKHNEAFRSVAWPFVLLDDRQI